MYYILFYTTVSDYLEKRAAYRAEHLQLAQQAQESGALVMAGALAELPMERCWFSKETAPK